MQHLACRPLGPSAVAPAEGAAPVALRRTAGQGAPVDRVVLHKNADQAGLAVRVALVVRHRIADQAARVDPVVLTSEGRAVPVVLAGLVVPTSEGRAVLAGPVVPTSAG